MSNYYGRHRAGLIFAVWFLSFSFFPRLILAVADWMSTILLHYTWRGLSANLECRSEMCCTWLAGNISPTCRSYNMVNFGPLAAEIISLVWGTPSNFNGFRVLAALRPNSITLSWSQTGPRLVADLVETSGIWRLPVNSSDEQLVTCDELTV